MKTNKIFGFILSAAALVFATTACEEKKEDLGAPSVTLNPSEITVEMAGGSQTIELTATRDWKTTISAEDAKWISVLPTSGSASANPVKIEVKVLENTGFDRSGTVTFDIGFDSKKLTVNQAGTGKIEGVIGGIVAGNENESVEVKDVLVTGVTTQSIVITDPTGSILVFAKGDPGAKVGDKVNVTGTTGKHNGLMQIASPTITVVSSGNTVTYPTPTTIDASNVTSFSSSVVSFVTFKGVPKKSGTYTNIYIGDVTTKDLSLSYYPGDLNSLLDKEIEVKGWYVGGGSHYQIVATNVNGTDITGTDGGSDTPDVPGVKMTLAQMLTADRTAGTVVESDEVLVGAITTKGYVATDGTSSIYVYSNSTPTVKVGDKVTVKGTLEDYYGVPEITSPKTTTVSSGNSVTYPTAKDINSTFDTYTSTFAEYVTFTAKVVKNGTYTNFVVDGATARQGALSSAPSALYAIFGEGDKVQVTGFFNTINESKEPNLLNVIAVEVKVLEKGEGGGDNPGGDTPGGDVTGSKFVKVTSAPSDWAGVYLIVCEDVNVAFKGSVTADAAGANVPVTISSNVITATSDLKKEIVTIAAVEGGYSVKTASGKYLYGISSSNKLNFADSYKEAQLNTIAMGTAGDVLLTSGTSVLRYNAQSGQERFRYYKAASYANQKAVFLYKLSE